MKKWGVRLIGCYFFTWGISEVYKLIIGTSSNSFFGIITTQNGEEVAFMAWVGVIVYLYIGFQLLRFDPRGRLWALTIFWLSVIALGFYLAWLALSPTSNFFSDVEMSVVLRVLFTDWPGEINGPTRIYSLLVGIFLFYSFLTYFLMRKDVKQLFEKTIIAEGPTNLIQGEKS